MTLNAWESITEGREVGELSPRVFQGLEVREMKRDQQEIQKKSRQWARRTKRVPFWKPREECFKEGKTVKTGVVVQLLSRVRLSATPSTASHQAFLFLTISRSLPQVHVHWISDAIQRSHPLLLYSPSVLNLSQHQGLFQWVKAGTKFLIRDRAQEMGAYTEKTVYLRQKQGRKTHPERKGMGVLSNEEEHSKEAVKLFI